MNEAPVGAAQRFREGQADASEVRREHCSVHLALPGCDVFLEEFLDLHEPRYPAELDE